MKRRGGVRAWVRWRGVAAVVVLAGVWGTSAFGRVIYDPRAGRVLIGILHGRIGGVVRPDAWTTPHQRWDVSYDASLSSARMRFTLGFTFWRFRADRVKPVGACRTCGYDTSGLAAGALCPECGKAAGSKT